MHTNERDLEKDYQPTVRHVQTKTYNGGGIVFPGKNHRPAAVCHWLCSDYL